MGKLTITIGIPAYNEEGNIGVLLTSLLNQKEEGFLIDKIIVVSDGSSDDTVRNVKTLNNPKIQLIKNKKRMGKSHSLNKILSNASGDILVFFDADIEIMNKSLMTKLSSFMVNGDADVAGLRILNLDPQSIFEKTLSVSMDIKRKIFETHNNGNNIYTCYGRAVAVKKDLYKKLHFNEEIIPDDAYIYLFAEKNGFRYRYSKDTTVYYRLPLTLEDHKKQSHRFTSTKCQLFQEFGEDFTKAKYKLPFSLILKSFFFYGLRSPFWVVSYIVVTILIKIQSVFSKPPKKTWNMVVSSKL